MTELNDTIRSDAVVGINKDIDKITCELSQIDQSHFACDENNIERLVVVTSQIKTILDVAGPDQHKSLVLLTLAYELNTLAANLSAFCNKIKKVLTLCVSKIWTYISTLIIPKSWSIEGNTGGSFLGFPSAKITINF
jgi:hypothetical protein